MRYLRYVFLLLAVALLFPVSASAVDVNVASGANVTLNGTFFTGGWGGGLVVGPETVVDGIFFPRSTQWDQGAVWWDSAGQYGTGQNLVLDLNGIFDISSFIVQADDNDAYILYYRNGSADAWHLVWDVPTIYDYGMQTRPDPTDDTRRYDLGYSITATDLMFMGNDLNSDLLYSVSEIQAFGHSVPEPATMLLFGAGFAGMWVFRKKIS